MDGSKVREKIQMERRKEVRLEHIAEEVGVSIVTVSNALNGRKGVSEELRGRIRDTAAAMGYQMPKSEQKKRPGMHPNRTLKLS